LHGVATWFAELGQFAVAKRGRIGAELDEVAVQAEEGSDGASHGAVTAGEYVGWKERC
jgi:hypothetical protein